MSWLNQINQIKGQITNFAQEVLSDAAAEEISTLEEIRKKNEDLDALCIAKDVEIANLRRQIAELQLKHTEAGRSSKSSIEKNAASLEDSWFWEPENTPSDTSVKNDNEVGSETSSGGDIIAISIEATKNTPDIIERLYKSLEDKEKRIQKLVQENVELNDNIQQLLTKNAEVNCNIEKLDFQHNIEIEKLLDLKNEYHQKYTDLNILYEDLKKKNDISLNHIENLQLEYNNLQKDHENMKAENIILINKLQICESENTNLNISFSSKEEELYKTIQKLINEKNNLETNCSELLQQNSKLLQRKNSEEKCVSTGSLLENFSDIDLQLDPEANHDHYPEVVKLSQDEDFIVLQEEIDTPSDHSCWNNINDMKINIQKLRHENARLMGEIAKIKNENKSQKYEGQNNDICELKTKNELLQSKLIAVEKDLVQCEANASDVESRLMMETVGLQKKLIDMETIMHQTKMEEIKDLLVRYFHMNVESNSNCFEDEALLKIREKMEAYEVLEKELHELTEEKKILEHENNTLRADVTNYETECSELMKNNEKILTELENFKHNKLETIQENNEESILYLEKQIEEISTQNKTLENAFSNLKQHFEEIDLEKQKLQIQNKDLQASNKNLQTLINNQKNELDVLENEKCNLIFEINEMKTDDKKSAMESEIFEYKQKIMKLEHRLGNLSRDHLELSHSMETSKSNPTEDMKSFGDRIVFLEKCLREKSDCLVSKEDKIRGLANELEQLKSQIANNLSEISSLSSENKNLQERFKEVQHFQKNLPDGMIQINEMDAMKEEIKKLNTEKDDLRKSLTSKHQENMDYYTEIQRLDKLLQAEAEKSKICQRCLELSNELENFRSEILFLKETTNLLKNKLKSEETNLKLLHNEKAEIIEENLILKKDLERLRQHLFETEEAHTQETLNMQNIIDSLNSKVNFLEEDVSKSTNAYTSASIRANQHAETLQSQYLLVLQQRDEISSKLSASEDRESKSQAAVVNLQCALEQFQKEKEKDIEQATQCLRKELKNIYTTLKLKETEIEEMQNKLVEANDAVMAAFRLSDQLETCKVTITTLREEIANLQEENEVIKEKLSQTVLSAKDKVEKTLIKSLIIGYVVSSTTNDKAQILRVISSVLDFNGSEIERIGLNRTQGSWLNNLIHGGNSDTNGKDGLAKAFVKFLEKESQPEKGGGSNIPRLLNVVGDRVISQQNIPERKISDHLIINKSMLSNEVVFDQFASTRNSSSILKDILGDT